MFLWKTLILGIIAVVASGCSGGSGGGESISALEIQGAIDLPVPLEPGATFVETGQSRFAVDSNGNFTVDDEGLTHPYLAIVSVNDVPVGISFFEHGSSEKKFTCQETAVCLVVLNTYLVFLPPELIPEALVLVKDTLREETPELAETLCDELALHSDALMNPSLGLKQQLNKASVAINEALLVVHN